MKVSIIAIGDELLIGQVIDTNSGEIARQIGPHGWEVNDVQVIADNATEIRRAVDRAFQLSDVVLTTGGLGPTKDDITKLTMCDIFGGEMRLDPATLENVKEVVGRRGISLNSLTADQAIVPTSCRVIQNRVGTAPIMWFERDGGKKVLVSMPGVPFETRQMFAEAVLPMLLDRFPSKEVVLHTNTIVAGMTESEVAIALAPIEDAFPPELHLAYLPKPALIRLRLDAHGTNRDKLQSLIDEATSKIRQRLAGHILSTGDRTIGEITLDTFRELGLTLATAESCTGGNIAHTITAIPGSSEYFKGSVVAYSNEVKRNLLEVKAETLDSFGAVSEQVALQMAEGVAKAISSDCAIATSGIAGPGGAVAGKPVGTVCIAVKTPKTTTTVTRHFPGSRDRVIDRATTEGLIMLLLALRQDR